MTPTTTAPAEPAYELDIADLHRWLDEHVRKPADLTEETS